MPWWVFGLRYLTGYDKKQVSKKEVIILLQAELVPTIKERVVQKRANEIDRQIVEDHENLEKYKLNAFRENNIKGMEDK